MAVTYGFYNSINEDRKYNAIQMSSIFDGIIRDGIFMHVGTSMMVQSGTGRTVRIGIGRAWFNHTWTLNDAIYPITLDAAEVSYDRIDLIVLDINANNATRANSFRIVKGTPAPNPVRPPLVKSTLHNQYALAAIRVPRNATTIFQANITNLVGTSETPFVTGPLQLMNIDALIAQWGDQWLTFYNDQVKYVNDTTEALLLTWHEFYDTQTAEIKDQNIYWRNQWNTWFTMETTTATQEMTLWREDRQATFDAWFASLQAILDGNVEANMAAAIIDLQNRTNIIEQFKHTLSNEFRIINPITDSTLVELMLLDSMSRGVLDSNGQHIRALGPLGSSILDDAGRPIDGVIQFCVGECQPNI